PPPTSLYTLSLHDALPICGSFNHRFAQPSRDAQAVSPLFYPTDIVPFSDLPAIDPVTGKKEGLLDRAFAENVAPKIFYVNTSYEDRKSTRLNSSHLVISYA